MSGTENDWEPDGEYTGRVEIFPEPADLDEIDDADLLPPKLAAIYRETLKAVASKQPILAGIGIRAILETVCKDRKSSGGNLPQKIDGLVALGDLSKQGSKALHALKALGDVAAHEVKAPSPAQLVLAMRVVEHLMDAVYILPHKSKRTFKLREAFYPRVIVSPAASD
jgi:Domain of unknown function (DUF4145)